MEIPDKYFHELVKVLDYVGSGYSSNRKFRELQSLVKREYEKKDVGHRRQSLYMVDVHFEMIVLADNKSDAVAVAQDRAPEVNYNEKFFKFEVRNRIENLDQVDGTWLDALFWTGWDDPEVTVREYFTEKTASKKPSK